MICYHPTAIIAIDDDKTFLMAMSRHLGIPNLRYFTSPTEAIENLQNQNPFKRLKEKLFKTSQTYSEDIDSMADQYSSHINLKKLHEEIYCADRFNDASVLIIDYHMGEINGIDVCKKLINHPAKKILLTGGTDKEKIAIEAFNNGIINRFISKADSNFPDQLKHAISMLQNTYFKDLTTSLVPNSSTIPLLEKTHYQNFIRNLKTELNADEFYLLDTSGSALFLSNGAPTWLIIKSSNELNDYINLASEAEYSENIFNELKNHKKIPFFFSDDDYQIPVHLWGDYLHECTPLPGNSNYFYSIIKNNFNNIDSRRLISPENYYKQFTENVK